MKPINFPGPETYQKVSDLYRSDSLTGLRRAFLEIIKAHNVPYGENLVKTNDWVNYLYYGSLVHLLIPDQSALIIDWGGLYGHVTKILQALGYENVFNYLLHKTPHYPFFEEPLQIPTRWGEDPNRFSLESNSVDVFISSGVLEHVREDGIGNEAMILGEIHRVLKDQGLLFIWNLPAKLGTSELLAMATGKWYHQYRYWKKEVLQLLRQGDFELLYFDKHKFLPGSLMTFIEKRIDPLLLLKADNRLSHLFPFNLLARDFVLVARKLSVSI
ncbi:MAG: hypothetical protein C0407_14195 [Desulfobacca sp.]|nr:hypothetical protein [Desulfobacca sp.]